MATPVHVVVDLKDVWAVDAVRIITDDGKSHGVPMNGTIHLAAVQIATVALGLHGLRNPGTQER